MRVIARKVHKNKYYYLQHSYRKNGRVYTKEKYLGLKIPLSLEKEVKLLRSDSMNEIYRKLELIKEGWREGLDKMSKAQIRYVVDSQVVDFVFNVLGLESRLLTKRDIEKILTQRVAPSKSLDKIILADSLGTLVRRILVSKEKISIDAIEGWHYELFHDATQFLHAKTITPLKKILSLIKRSSLHPIEIAALVLFRFERLHPYEQGNAVLSRILMDIILLQRHYPPMDFSLSDKVKLLNAMKKGEDNFVAFVIKKYMAIYKKISK